MLLLTVLLSACSTSQAPPPAPVDPLEQTAINALQLGFAGEADSALTGALVRYQMLDDLNGQWRIRHMIATRALLNDQAGRALDQAEAMAALAELIDDNPVYYETRLLQGRLTGDVSHFRSALSLAADDIQRAVCHAYLGNTKEAFALVEGQTGGNAPDLAFVFYQHASATRDAQMFLLALEHYKRAADARGMADTLVHLAHLADDAGDGTAAGRYADRAITILTASRDEKRAAAVTRWRAEL